MPANRPNHRPAAGGLLMANPRRPLAALALALLIIGGCIPAVSADEIYNRTFAEIADTTIESPDMGVSTGGKLPGIYISDVNAIASKTTLRQVEADIYAGQIYGTAAALPTYHWDNAPLNIGGNTVGYADLGFFKFVDGTTTKIRLYAWVHELDVSGYTGSQKVYFNLAGYEHSDFTVTNGNTPPGSELDIRFCATGTTVAQHRGWAILWDSWENTVIVENSTQNDIEFYSIDVKRNIDGKSNPSVCGLYTTLGYYLDTNYPNSGTNDIHFDHIQSNFFPMTMSIKNLLTGTWHNDTISLGGSVNPIPGAATVNIYIQNSQNGNLISNANLAVLASTNGNEIEIINTTVQSGVASFTLQKTGGGQPNPDYYRAVATVPGYSQIVENHSFTLNGPHDVIIEMRPDSGGPTDPENTYLEFYVRDLNANSIPAASIQCNNQIKTTNSAGYAIFEVGKNATYPYKVSKAGYVTIEGTATVEALPRYVVNVVLGPGSVPTYTPTPDPSTGETPGATPTPDTRTNEEKGQAVIDMIADFAEPIALLAIVATVFGLMQMMMPRRR